MPIPTHEVGRRSLRLLSRPGFYPITEAIFLRSLGVIYFAAFASLLPQITGLIGSHGIVPAVSALHILHSQLTSWQAFLAAPTLFALRVNDTLLVGSCVLGCFSALLMMLWYAAVRVSAIVCWVLYLSLSSIGSPFLTFQWDALLLEAGFLALLMGSPWLVWAFRLLFFRLMFQSGAVKLLSGDVSWENLHALRYHFLTQPLPNPLAYYAYRLPAAVLDSLTAIALGIELIAPFLLFGPRRVRHVGVFLLLLLQLAILLTGNYAFFNLLTIALCLWGLDDKSVAAISWLGGGASSSANTGPRETLRFLGNALLLLYIACSGAQLMLTFRLSPGPLRPALEALSPFQVVNSYGLFAVMTTDRPEIVLQGSNDQEHWEDYSFKYKPGELHRALPVIAPYQPRLDWQMWFAALGSYAENPWVGSLMYRILVGDPVVLHLMDRPPFVKPPKYLRAIVYDYRFTSLAERARTGAVWERTLRGTWFGPVSLTGR